MSTVLYDNPGPKARLRNHLYTVLFVVVLALLLWWVLAAMDDKGQLEWRNWEPYLGGTEAWETYLIPGLMNTLKAAGLSIIIALPIGAFFGIARLSDHPWVRWPAGVIVEFFRAVPVLILMLAANIAYVQFTTLEPSTRLLYAVVTGLVLYNGSVLAEVVRAGILSIPRGQSEAAMAVGMRKGQLMRNILLPQAVTAMLPAIVSQLVVIVKDTAIGGAVLGFGELIAKARPASSFYFNVIATLVVIAAIYIVLNFILTSFASWLEKWLRTRKRGGTSVVAGDWVEEQAPGIHFEEGESGYSRF
ncbi:amino acid ABC transporter permease [Haloechinothrix salitolerans]|uniref:Amino acid ABC transporter permease n=1 Tax=Haloechinothrix salitolerans TaxID=926830 RepID=A0ABW2C5M6_9PSEU